MIFKIEIDCDSAAFDDNDCGLEIARILQGIIPRTEPWGKQDFKDGWSIKLYDINGNHVGDARMTQTAAEENEG